MATTGIRNTVFRLWPRWLYALEVVALGLPTIFHGGLMALLGAIVGGAGLFIDSVYILKSLAYFGMGAGGLIGILAWLWLSWRYLREGDVGLLRSRRLWVGLGCGVLAAIAPSVVLLSEFFQDPSRGLGNWTFIYFGPALLVPTLHLILARLRARSGKAAPGHTAQVDRDSGPPAA